MGSLQQAHNVDHQCHLNAIIILIYFTGFQLSDQPSRERLSSQNSSTASATSERSNSLSVTSPTSPTSPISEQITCRDCINNMNWSNLCKHDIYYNYYSLILWIANNQSNEIGMPCWNLTGYTITWLHVVIKHSLLMYIFLRHAAS